MRKYNIIKLDYDTKKWSEVEKKISKGIPYLRDLAKAVTVYKTQNGYHIYINTNCKFSFNEIISIQIFLGSDYRREKRNLKRKKNRLWQTKFNLKTGKLISQEHFCKGETKSLEFSLFEK